MEKNNHGHPIFIMTRDPRPGDRETRMHPAPGKWVLRTQSGKEEEA